MKQHVRQHTLAAGIGLVSVVVLFASVWGWWHYVYSNPRRVFERMLATSLSSPSVTKVTTDPNETQKLEQTTQLSVNPTAKVRSVNVLEQAGSTVKTESIATPHENYVRYNDIQTTQKNKSGGALDFSGILGIWAISGNDDLTSENSQLFSQAALGVVPIAQLSTQNRQALLKQISDENVYGVDYNKVTKFEINGRPTYTYAVGLKPRAYISMLKNFSKYLGTDELKDVDSTQYPEGPLVNITITVDVWSSQLVRVGYQDSERSEAYSAFGAYNAITIPSDAISRQELQTKLQQIR